MAVSLNQQTWAYSQGLPWTDVPNPPAKNPENRKQSMPIYEVALTLEPTIRQSENGGSEQLVLKSEQVTATDSHSAVLQVGMEHADAINAAVKKDDLPRLKVHVRTFTK